MASAILRRGCGAEPGPAAGVRPVVATIGRIATLAPIPLRLTARVLDVMISGSLALVAGQLMSGASDVALLAVGAALVTAYEALFVRWWRATPGKLLAGLRVVDREAWLAGTPAGLGWAPSVARGLIVAMAVVLPVVGVAYAVLAGVMMAQRAFRLTPHDLVAGSVVTLRR